MSKLRLAICDGDGLYCRRLDEYLHENLKLEFDILSFTELSILTEFAKSAMVSLIIISERMFSEMTEEEMRLFRNILVLEESGQGAWGNELWPKECRVLHVSKFKAASAVVDSVLELCVNSPEDFRSVAVTRRSEKGTVYGFFSPITRCGQTSLAAAVARTSSKKGKTIFLSFESFSSLPHTLGIAPKEDITDLMYYAECERAKLPIYLEKIKVSRDSVDFILPARCASQIKEVTGERIRELIDVLIKDVGYEYVILDITEYPEGFADMLLLCDRVFTIVRNSSADAYRQKSYDEMLIESGFEAVKAKTTLCRIPELKDKSLFDNYAAGILESEGA